MVLVGGLCARAPEFRVMDMMRPATAEDAAWAEDAARAEDAMWAEGTIRSEE